MAALHLVGLQTESKTFEEGSTNSEITRNTNSFEDVNEFFMRSNDNIVDCTENGEVKKQSKLDVGFLPGSRSRLRKIHNQDEDMVTDLPPRKNTLKKKSSSRSLSPSKTTGGTESSATIMSEIFSTNPGKGPYVRKINESHSFKNTTEQGFHDGSRHDEMKEEVNSIHSPSFMQQISNFTRTDAFRRSSKESASTSRSRESSLLQSIDNRLTQLISNNNGIKENAYDTQIHEIKQTRGSEDEKGDFHEEGKPRMIQTKSKSSLYSNISSLKNSEHSYNEEDEYDTHRLPVHVEHYDGDIDELEDGKSRSGLSVGFPHERKLRPTSDGSSNNDEHNHKPLHEDLNDNVTFIESEANDSRSRGNRSLRDSLKRGGSIRSYFSNHSNRYTSKLTRESSRKSIAKRRKNDPIQKYNESNDSRLEEKSKKDDESDDVEFFGWGAEDSSTEAEEEKDEIAINDSFSDDGDDLIFGFANNAAALRAKARREETIQMQLEEEFDSKRPWRKPPPEEATGSGETKDVAEDLTTISINSDKSGMTNGDNISIVSEADSIEVAQSAIQRFEKFGAPMKRPSTKKFMLLEAFSEGEENDIPNYEGNEIGDIVEGRNNNTGQYSSSSDEEEDEDSKDESDEVKSSAETCEDEESSFCTSDEELLVGFGRRVASIQSPDHSEISKFGSPVSNLSHGLPRRKKYDATRSTFVSTSSSETHDKKTEKASDLIEENEKKPLLKKNKKGEEEDIEDCHTINNMNTRKKSVERASKDEESVSDFSKGSDDSTPMIEIKMRRIQTGDSVIMNDSIIAETINHDALKAVLRGQCYRKLVYIFIFVGICGIASLGYALIHFKTMNKALEERISKKIPNQNLTSNVTGNEEDTNMTETFNGTSTLIETHKEPSNTSNVLNQTLVTNDTNVVSLNRTNTTVRVENATHNMNESFPEVMFEHSTLQTINITNHIIGVNMSQKHSGKSRKRGHNVTKTAQKGEVEKYSNTIAQTVQNISNTNFIQNSNVTWHDDSKLLNASITAGQGNSTVLEQTLQNNTNQNALQNSTISLLQNHTSSEESNKDLLHLQGDKFLSPEWKPDGYILEGISAGDLFGASTSISDDGKVLAIAAPYSEKDKINFGYVNIYVYVSGIWTLSWTLHGSALGDQFGRRLSLSGNGQLLAIAARNSHSNDKDNGIIQVYRNAGNGWFKFGKAIEGTDYDMEGYSCMLSRDGSHLVVSAIGFDSIIYGGMNNGRVRTFHFDDTDQSWRQSGQDLQGTTSFSLMGQVVSISEKGNIIAVSFWINGKALANVYKFDGVSWMQMGPSVMIAESGKASIISLSLSNDGYTLATCSNEVQLRKLNSHGKCNTHFLEYNSWNRLGETIFVNDEFEEIGSKVQLILNGKRVAILGRNTLHKTIFVRLFNFHEGKWKRSMQEIVARTESEEFQSSFSISEKGSFLALGSPGINSTPGKTRVFSNG